MSIPLSSSSSSSSTSSSSSSSSSLPGSSSSSSPSSPCGEDCEWKLVGVYWDQVKVCSSPSCRCDEPLNLVAPRPPIISIAPQDLADVTATTPCVPREAPFPIPSTSTSSIGVSVARTGASGSVAAEIAEIVLLDLPNHETGASRGGVNIRVLNGSRSFRTPGWTVTLARRGVTAIGPPFVDPPTVPLLASSKFGVLAMVTLPEADGLVQYCVPVLEPACHAELYTSEWTVLFQKDRRLATS